MKVKKFGEGIRRFELNEEYGSICLRMNDITLVNFYLNDIELLKSIIEMIGNIKK